jgi:hypothetical protein
MLIAGYSPFQAPHHRALFRKIRAGDYVFHEQYWKNGEYQVILAMTHHDHDATGFSSSVFIYEQCHFPQNN